MKTIDSKVSEICEELDFWKARTETLERENEKLRTELYGYIAQSLRDLKIRDNNLLKSIVTRNAESYLPPMLEPEK
jgi:hypothetical protein